MEKSAEAFRTISEVAEELDLPQHVLRFWETRFTQIKPLKRGGGRRYYRPEDVELLRAIRQLLYGEGYTIKGVQKILKEQGLRSVIAAYRAASAAGGERMSLIFGPTVADAENVVPQFPPRASPFVSEPPRSDVPTSFETEDEAISAISLTGLREGDLRRLESVLAELAECERILLAARRG